MFEVLRRVLPVPRPPGVVNLEGFGGTAYVVGDVHGRLDLLRGLEARIVADAQGRDGEILLIYVGDLVDRGLDSFDVVEHVMARPPAGFRRICLSGNHEEMLLRFVAKPSAGAAWLDFGGRETLLSYGAGPADLQGIKPGGRKMRFLLERLIPQEHIAFLQKLPHAVALRDFLVSHAGGDPDKPFGEQSVRDLVWGVEGFMQTRPLYRREMVHGHFMVERAERTAGRISVDTGAFASGRLSAARLQPDRAVEFLVYEGHQG